MAFKHTTSFHELLTSPFAGDVNALCWSRSLPGDYAEVVAKLGPGEGLVALDEERLRGLELSGKGKEAVEQMLVDLALLRDAGRDPVLNIIYGYPKDEDGGPVPTDVMSWHVDSAPVEADTWLCTYHGAPSEGLLNEQALRKVDDPKIRAELRKLYGGADDPAFTDWMSENYYDLHYAPQPGAKPYSFGVGPLWRITVEWPGNRLPLQNPQVSGFRSQVSVSLPCVHRAPVTDTPRLLLIS